MAENFVCGGVAAALAICVVNPIDVVKSRLQMQGELGADKPKQAYRGIVSAMVTIGQKEGLAGLYRGLPAAVLFQLVGNSCRFGIYHAGKKLAGTDKKQSSLKNLGLALTAGGVAGLVSCPFFTVKTQMQVQTSVSDLSTGHQRQHSSFADACQSILRDEGVTGFWRGIPVFLLRCVALVGAQMTTYDAAKHWLLHQAPVEMSDGPLVHCEASAIAAGAGCLCMQPFDLVGSRMMNQPVDGHGRPVLYNGALDCFVKTVQSEGVQGLYKGVAANYSRMAPQYILTFVFFEQLIKLVPTLSGATPAKLVR